MSNIISFKDFSEIWNHGPIVIPDTNVLLYLYRCSSSTSEFVLDILSRISNHIWIPHQVNAEFLSIYQGEIKREKEKYRAVTNQVHSITQKAKHDIKTRFHRYQGLDFPKIKELGDIIETKLLEIEAEATRFQEDIKEEIDRNELILDKGKAKLFMDQLAAQGKVGDPFNYSEMLALYAEGDSRYLRKIPPGYKDEKEKDKKDESKTRKFGDLIIWKQILRHAGGCNRPIIFITNDNKSDWWELDQDGRRESSRPELTEEFNCYSDHSFTMLDGTEFINHIAELLNLKLQSTRAYFELNGESIVTELMSSGGWEEALSGDVNLTSYLIHSGDLQFAVSNPLSDVEVNEIYQDLVNIDLVDYDVFDVTLAGTFTLGVYVTIKQIGDMPVRGEVKVSGYVNVQFEHDEKKQEVELDNVEIQISGLNVTDFYEYIQDDESEDVS